MVQTWEEFQAAVDDMETWDAGFLIGLVAGTLSLFGIADISLLAGAHNLSDVAFVLGSSTELTWAFLLVLSPFAAMIVTNAFIAQDELKITRPEMIGSAMVLVPALGQFLNVDLHNMLVYPETTLVWAGLAAASTIVGGVLVATQRR